MIDPKDFGCEITNLRIVLLNYLISVNTSHATFLLNI